MAALRQYFQQEEETMEKIWLKSYPPGIPAEIDVDAFRSLGDLFERSVARFADKPAYHCMGKSITYAELDALMDVTLDVAAPP